MAQLTCEVLRTEHRYLKWQGEDWRSLLAKYLELGADPSGGKAKIGAAYLRSTWNCARMLKVVRRRLAQLTCKVLRFGCGSLRR